MEGGEEMTRKEKWNIVKAGAASYVVCSGIAWLKHGGIQFFNQAGSWTVKFHKTMGVIDVFRMNGHLSKMEVFNGDALFLLFGFGTSIIAMIGMKFVEYINHEPNVNKTQRGYKVELNKKPGITDFEL